MSVVQHQVRSIFNACLQETDAAARAAAVIRQCQGDEVLRAQVLVLLQAHDRIGDFLERPLIALSADETPGKCRDNAHDDTIDLPATTTMDALLPETSVGPFRIRELIGEGGMGLVYVAEQEFPIRRRVALKLIKPGMDSREVIARFQAERQALAMMNHPNIACVLDAGTTETGRPYFVMELVHGLRITEFCDQQRMTVTERLKLFVDVCRAVQHAHQQGIIHRDIKPSNVMVTQHDGKPVVKVIDFGVAKAILGTVTEQTQYTSWGRMIGTPMYMSPEQAELSGVPVDTRTDIYSLGILLYSLLTGTTPLDPDTIRSTPFDDLRRIIREKEPRRPSLQVPTIQRDRLSTIALQRQLDSHRLAPLLQGDLDWIVMKALEKDRNRRYDSVGALIDDLERYFENEPILARPPSKIYQFQKLYRRHKVLLMTTSLVILSLITGTGLALLQTSRALRAERAANNERDRAQESDRRTQQLLYAADMRLASDAFLENDVVRALEALNRHQPRPGRTDLRSFEWYYLSARAGITSRELRRSDKALYFCCRIPGANQVACCGADAMIRILDADSGTQIAEMESGQGEMNGLAVSPDGLLLASAGDDGTIQIWDLQILRPGLRIKAHQNPAFQVAFTKDGQKIVSCGGEPDARVWSVIDGAPLGVLDSQGIDLETLTINPADIVALGGRTGKVFVHQLSDVDAVSLVPELPSSGRSDIVSCSGNSPEGRFLAEGHSTGTLNLRLAESPSRVWKRFVLHDAVQSLAFSPDHQWLAAGDRSGTIILFPLESDDVESSAEFFAGPARRQVTWNAHEGRIHGLTFTADSQHVISAGQDGRLIRWSPIAEDALRHVADWIAKVLNFQPDGRIVAGDDHLVRYSRDVNARWNVMETLDSHVWAEPFVRVTVARDSGLIFWRRDSENSIRSMTPDQVDGGIVWQGDDGDRPGMMVVSPDGELLAIEVLSRESSNILDQPDQVKILDLGLASLADNEGVVDHGLTGTGMIMGSVDFMAPEQGVNTKRADARSDIYSLGCTFYYLLTAQVPFQGETAVEKILAHRDQPIPDLGKLRPDVPAAFVHVFQQMVAKQPEDRYQTMAEVLAALRIAGGSSVTGLPQGNAPTPVDPALQKFFQAQVSSDQVTTATVIQAPSSVEATRAETLVSSMFNTDAVEAESFRTQHATRTKTVRTPGSPQPPKSIGRWLLLGGGLIGIVAVVLGIFLRVQTPAGTIILEIDQPELAGATVMVDDQKKITIQTGKGAEPIEVTGDEKTHTLKVVKGGFETFTKSSH